MPVGCIVTYECLTLEGSGKTFSCSDLSELTFYIDSGNFEFKSRDKSKFPPGDYSLTIKGTTGTLTTQSDSVQVQFTIVDSCSLASFILPSVSPIDDLTYTLGQEPVSALFSKEDLAILDLPVPDDSCGDFAIEFINSDGSELVQGLFTSSLSESSISTFTVLKQSSQNMVGQYFVSYRVTLEDYPDVEASEISAPFLVVIEPDILDGDFEENNMPEWLQNLEDQSVIVGNGLYYHMGEPTNEFETETDVEVDLRAATEFAFYDNVTNAFVVNQTELLPRHEGFYKIWVFVEYLDLDDRKVFYRNFFYLRVIYNEEVLPVIVEEEPTEQVFEPVFEDYGIEVVEESDFEGFVVNEIPVPVEEKEQPIPYIKYVSPTGVVTIIWDRRMKPFEKPEQIPPAKVAVERTILDRLSSNGQRRLQSQTEVPRQGQRGRGLVQRAGKG